MIWRVGSSFLVGDGPHRLIDAAGAVTNEWTAHEWSDESYLARTTYLVIDRQLIDRTEAGHHHHHMEDSVNDTVILDGLVEDTTEETARFIATVLGDLGVVLEEKRLREEKAAAARVDAIEGARASLADADCEHARILLVERVARWGDERAGQLLRTLIDLVRAGTPQAALMAYARGCMLACFAIAVPPLVEGEPVDSPLAERVFELAGRVKGDGDRQAEIDANANARELWAAASALGFAARLLGKMG